MDFLIQVKLGALVGLLLLTLLFGFIPAKVQWFRHTGGTGTFLSSFLVKHRSPTRFCPETSGNERQLTQIAFDCRDLIRSQTGNQSQVALFARRCVPGRKYRKSKSAIHIGRMMDWGVGGGGWSCESRVNRRPGPLTAID